MWQLTFCQLQTSIVKELIFSQLNGGESALPPAFMTKKKALQCSSTERLAVLSSPIPGRNREPLTCTSRALTRLRF